MAGSFGSRLRALRTAKGLSQVELARLIRRHPTAIGPYERDEYAPPRELVDRIAHLLDTTPEYLWFGRSPRRPGLMVGGRLGPGGAARPLETLQPPRLVRIDRMQAWIVEDDANAPIYTAGQLVLVAAEPVEPGEALGRDALVRLADGRELLRRVLPGPQPDAMLLALAHGGAAMLAPVLEARLVLGVLNAAATAEDPGGE